MARFKEMCLDTTDPQSTIARFWAEVAGVRVSPGTTRPADVVGGEEWQGLAICPVPEPKTVKNRLHFDVYARSVADVVALGARVDRPSAETGFGWTTMLDPEGNEFCVLERPDDTGLPAYRIHGLGIDSVDPSSIARWWAEALGARLVDQTAHGENWWTVEHATPDPDGPTWDFAPVPEPKTVKNRVHFDLYGTVEEFLDRGATRLWDTPRWVVLADPEGNEFCVFPDPGA